MAYSHSWQEFFSLVAGTVYERSDLAQKVHDPKQHLVIIQTIWAVASNLGLSPGFAPYLDCELSMLLDFSLTLQYYI